MVTLRDAGNERVLDGTTSIEEILALDLNDPSAAIAADMLMGHDEFCVRYLQAFRSNKL